jgi:hypothetical protein
MWRGECWIALGLAGWLMTAFAAPVAAVDAGPGRRVGIIGLDTSHAPAFAQMFNAADAGPELHGFRVVAAFPGGSPDIESSIKRVPQYTEQLRAMGVEIVDSIPTLLAKVDVVLLESVDGRPHLSQVLPVLKAGKPVFVDKPLGGSLSDCVAIFAAAEHYKVPVFSSSSLRYTEGAQAIRNGKLGDVLGAETYSPATLEKSHLDLFWYGIHGVESLFTVMGTGCESVTRVHSPDCDVVVGTWGGSRLGTFRGTRAGAGGYGGTAFGSQGVEPIGPFQGYRPLVVKIAEFFETRQPPVSPAETLEIYAFMEAADESKRRGGASVSLKQVMDKARREAHERLTELLR